MSGCDADGTPLNDSYSDSPYPPKGKPKMKPSSPIFSNNGDEKNKTAFSNKWVIASAIAVVFSIIAFVYAVVNFYNTPSANTYHPDIVVAYTADQDVLHDGPIQLGYPYHRFSVTCDATGTMECVLEVEDKNKHDIKRFPYVEQEWFTPGRKNRPYHTLDIIKSLPSMNGNANLRFGHDPKANAALVSVMEKNGWIEQPTNLN